ncbi:MAG TPA: hypothetical protein VGG51_03235 [Candidatus Cybelea sp.]|jgi:hypothetical protein
MTEMDKVWARIKAHAAQQATHTPQLGLSEAVMVVVRICREELSSYPPDEAIEYLTAELLRLMKEARVRRFDRGVV